MGKLKQSLIDTDQEDQSSDNEPAFYSAEDERAFMIWDISKNPTSMLVRAILSRWSDKIKRIFKSNKAPF